MHSSGGGEAPPAPTVPSAAAEGSVVGDSGNGSGGGSSNTLRGAMQTTAPSEITVPTVPALPTPAASTANTANTAGTTGTLAVAVPAPQGSAQGDDGGDSITFSDPAAVPSWEDAMPRGGYIMPYKTHGTHTCEHNVTQEVLLLRGSAVAGNARSGLLNFDICSGTVSSCPCRPRSRFQLNHHPGPDRPP